MQLIGLVRQIVRFSNMGQALWCVWFVESSHASWGDASWVQLINFGGINSFLVHILFIRFMRNEAVMDQFIPFHRLNKKSKKWEDGPPHSLEEKVHFSSLTFTKVYFSSLNYKTRQTTSVNFLNRAFYLPGVVLKEILSLSFLFILAKSLKNHSKS
jgi:hypothetical protein